MKAILSVFKKEGRRSFARGESVHRAELRLAVEPAPGGEARENKSSMLKVQGSNLVAGGTEAADSVQGADTAGMAAEPWGRGERDSTDMTIAMAAANGVPRSDGLPAAAQRGPVKGGEAAEPVITIGDILILIYAVLLAGFVIRFGEFRRTPVTSTESQGVDLPLGDVIQEVPSRPEARSPRAYRPVGPEAEARADEIEAQRSKFEGTAGQALSSISTGGMARSEVRSFEEEFARVTVNLTEDQKQALSDLMTLVEVPGLPGMSQEFHSLRKTGQDGFILQCAQGTKFRFNIYGEKIKGAEKFVILDIMDVTDPKHSEQVGTFEFRINVGGSTEEYYAIAEYDRDGTLQKGYRPAGNAIQINEPYGGRNIGTAAGVLALLLAKKYKNHRFDLYGVEAEGFFRAARRHQEEDRRDLLDFKQVDPKNPGHLSFDLDHDTIPEIPVLRPHSEENGKWRLWLEEAKREYEKIAGKGRKETGYNLSMRRFNQAGLRLEDVVNDSLLDDDARKLVVKAIAFGLAHYFSDWGSLDAQGKKALIGHLAEKNMNGMIAPAAEIPRWIDVRKLSGSQREAFDILWRLEQQHLFEDWQGPGINDDRKLEFLDQVMRFEGAYPGGLRNYLKNARLAIKAAQKGIEGEIEIPNVFQIRGPEDLVKYQTEAVRHANRLGFVLVAGGKGERLGLPEVIKLAIPVSLVSDMPLAEWYVRNILEFQYQGNQMNGETRLNPLFVMTSQNNDAITRSLFDEHDYFGLKHRQVTFEPQAAVPTMIFDPERDPGSPDFKIRLAKKKGDAYTLDSNAHGHGDVHMLFYQLGLVDRWMESGIERVVFFQDTNALTFHAALANVGVSRAKNFEMNLGAVPRRAGEPIGGLGIVGGIVRNVEYALLGKKDKPVPETGMSPFPGNINVFDVAIGTYKELLLNSLGIVPELINIAPSKLEEDPATGSKRLKNPARTESNMQDVAISVGNSGLGTVGITSYPKDQAFVPGKNSFAKAMEAMRQGLEPDMINNQEAALLALCRSWFAAAGVAFEGPESVPGRVRHTRDVSWNEGPKVFLQPDFAQTVKDVREKVRGGRITDRSVLVIDGRGLELVNLDLDGALIIKIPEGVKLKISGLSVVNDSWEYRDLSPEEWELIETEPQDRSAADLERMEQLGIADHHKARGFKLVKHDQMTIDLTGFDAGEYEMDGAGNIQRVDGRSEVRFGDANVFIEDAGRKLEALVEGMPRLFSPEDVAVMREAIAVGRSRGTLLRLRDAQSRFVTQQGGLTEDESRLLGGFRTALEALGGRAETRAKQTASAQPVMVQKERQGARIIVTVAGFPEGNFAAENAESLVLGLQRRGIDAGLKGMNRNKRQISVNGYEPFDWDNTRVLEDILLGRSEARTDEIEAQSSKVEVTPSIFSAKQRWTDPSSGGHLPSSNLVGRSPRAYRPVGPEAETRQNAAGQARGETIIAATTALPLDRAAVVGQDREQPLYTVLPVTFDLPDDQVVLRLSQTMPPEARALAYTRNPKAIFKAPERPGEWRSVAGLLFENKDAGLRSKLLILFEGEDKETIRTRLTPPFLERVTIVTHPASAKLVGITERSGKTGGFGRITITLRSESRGIAETARPAIAAAVQELRGRRSGQLWFRVITPGFPDGDYFYSGINLATSGDLSAEVIASTIVEELGRLITIPEGQQDRYEVQASASLNARPTVDIRFVERSELRKTQNGKAPGQGTKGVGSTANKTLSRSEIREVALDETLPVEARVQFVRAMMSGPRATGQGPRLVREKSRGTWTVSRVLSEAAVPKTVGLPETATFTTHVSFPDVIARNSEGATWRSEGASNIAAPQTTGLPPENWRTGTMTAGEGQTIYTEIEYDETAVEKIARWFTGGILLIRAALSKKAVALLERLGIRKEEAVNLAEQLTAEQLQALQMLSEEKGSGTFSIEPKRSQTAMTGGVMFMDAKGLVRFAKVAPKQFIKTFQDLAAASENDPVLLTAGDAGKITAEITAALLNKNSGLEPAEKNLVPGLLKMALKVEPIAKSQTETINGLRQQNGGMVTLLSSGDMLNGLEEGANFAFGGRLTSEDFGLLVKPVIDRMLMPLAELLRDVPPSEQLRLLQQYKERSIGKGAERSGGGYMFADYVALTQSLIAAQATAKSA